MRGNYRDALGEAFLSVGHAFPDLMVVTADVSKSTRSIRFKNEFPDRFLSVGIAEADAVGISAGIATFGLPVIFTAYAMFATEKPFEQIRNMIAYPNLNVKIVATHGGINVGEDGVTHQAVEDIAIMRAMPRMRVVTVADPGELSAALHAVVASEGPCYLRVPRAPYEVIHESGSPDFRIGKSERLREGRDATIIATGMMVWDALQAAERLDSEGIQIRVENVRTIKPLDMDMVRSAAIETGAVVTAEDHNKFGGLGGAVAEALVRSTPVVMEQVALNDTFAESGDAYEVLHKYGLDSQAIYERTLAAIRRKGHKGRR